MQGFATNFMVEKAISTVSNKIIQSFARKVKLKNFLSMQKTTNVNILKLKTNK
jgi:hypothetical protein